MRIAFHIRAESVFLPLIREISKRSPPAQLLIICSGSRPAGLSSSIIFEQIKKPLTKNSSLWYWNQVTLRRILLLKKVDVFVSEYGFCCMRSDIPQWIYFDPAFMEQDNVIPSRMGMKLFFPSMAKKAARIITSETYAEEILSKYFPAHSSKALQLSLAEIKDPSLSDWKNREDFLEKVSAGKEYIFCKTSKIQSASIIELLKAFSRFKKFQKSGIRLMLADDLQDPSSYIPSFTSYKFRDEVITTCMSQDDMWERVAAAFALIELPGKTLNDVLGETALRNSIPLISGGESRALANYGNAAAFVAFSHEEIAGRISEIYKSEPYRQMLAAKGLAHFPGEGLATSAVNLLLNFAL